MIDLVCATRLTSDEFWGRSALGLSLRRMAHDVRLKPRVYFENARGLPSLYNERIAAENLAMAIGDVEKCARSYSQHQSWSAILGRALSSPFGSARRPSGGL